MSTVSNQIRKVEVADEFRVCPACGYEFGFHCSFIAQGKGKPLKVVFICPNCGARYDVGETI